MTTTERLSAMLADYKLQHRVDAGDLVIKIGKENWPEGYYHDPYFVVSIPLALDIALAIPTIKEFSVYYARIYDFHHIQFTYGDDSYIIQWYKVFTITRKSDGKKAYLGGRPHKIADWLKKIPDQGWYDVGQFGNPWNIVK